MTLKNRILISLVLQILTIYLYMHTPTSNFGYLPLWLFPIYFMSLFFYKWYDTIIIVLAFFYMFTTGTNFPNIYILILANITGFIMFAIIFLNLGIIYRMFEVNKYFCIVSSSVFILILLFFYAVLLGDYSYVTENILGFSYVSIFASTVAYITKQQVDALPKKR